MEIELDRVDEKENAKIPAVISPEIIPRAEVEVDEKELDWSPIILLPEFLERVFKSFGNKQLMGFRAVCKSWNDEICRILTIRPVPIQKGYGFACISPTKYAELNSLLRASLNPGILIKEVQVSSEMNSPVVEVHKNLFRDFGRFVKYLKVAKDSTDLQILTTFLAQEDTYCPNLRKLNYCASKSETPVPTPFAPIFKSPLKVSKLWFQSSQDLEAPAQVAIFNSIVQNSPQLTGLHIKSHDSQAMEEFFKKLQTLPLLTCNLKDISTKTSDFSWLKGLAKCHFKTKLKKAKFHFIIDLAEDVQFEERHPSEKDLMDFLTHVANSLEVLDLYVDRKKEKDPIYYPKDLTNLPGMPELRILCLKSCQLSENVEGLDFVKKLPSLRFLQIFKADIDEGVEGLAASDFVNHNLEVISFQPEYNTSSNFCTFPAVHLLDRTFPNLKVAFVTLGDFPFDEVVKEQQYYFEHCFKALSEMKNLEDVFIYLDHLDQSEHLNQLDLTRAFSFFKEAPCLEAITFMKHVPLLHSFPKEPWLRELLSAPKLRRVDFYGFTMGNEQEYKESVASYGGREPECQEEANDAWCAEATQAFAAHNIRLQIQRRAVARKNFGEGFSDPANII